MTMLDLINQARAGRNLPPLAHNAQLAEAAVRHARDLASGRVDLGNSHVGSDGSTVVQRVTAAGYRAADTREMTGWGWDGDVTRMVDYWLNSAVHQPIIYSGDLPDVGIGYVYQPGSAWLHYWTVVLARPSGQPQPPPPPPVEQPPVVYVPVVVGRPPVVPGTGSYDLLEYLRGDGRSYRVGNSRGSYEIFQSQTNGDRFYSVKAWDDLSIVHWEEFRADAEFIRRDIDTSPGGGLFYRQFDAPWVRRRMSVGESFSQAKHVQFYRLDTCVPVEQYSGDVIDSITLVAHHARYTFRARDWTPVTLDDVIQLRWSGGEDYWYAKSFGLVGWGRTHQDANSPAWSAISELRPDVGRLERLRIACL